MAHNACDTNEESENRRTRNAKFSVRLNSEVNVMQSEKVTYEALKCVF